MKVEFPKVNNKLAFFDFDRTLVAHDYSKEYNKVDNYLMECVFALTSLAEEHAGDRPLPCMQWYAKKLFEEGYGLYCLTHEIFNLRDQLKQDQLSVFYPDTPMTYLTVDKPEHKIDMMKAVAMTECCDFSDVIFVDDRMDTIYSALAVGIDAKHLSDIVVMYESQNAPQEQDVVIKPIGMNQTYIESSDIMTAADEKVSNMAVTEQESKLTKRSFQDRLQGADAGISDEELGQLYGECRKIADGGAQL